MPGPSAAITFEDAVLVQRTQRGDMAAFGQLIAKYQDKVFNTCWRMCGHHEDARDLTQEAFLRALESMASFRRKSGFYTWIFRIAVNLAISHRRKEKRAVAVSLDGTDSGWTEGTQAGGLLSRVSNPSDCEPDAPVRSSETQQFVLQALGELEEDHRAVVVLRDIESFDYREIAEILDVPTGTVKSRLHRARMALRGKLQPVIGEA